MALIPMLNHDCLLLYDLVPRLSCTHTREDKRYNSILVFYISIYPIGSTPDYEEIAGRAMAILFFCDVLMYDVNHLLLIHSGAMSGFSYIGPIISYMST